MDEENKTNVEQEFSPIEEIKKLRSEMVSKQEYEKVLKERNDYFKALLNGDEADGEEESEDSVDYKKRAEDIRKALFSPESGLSNLEYAKNALELRDIVKKQNGHDIFVGTDTSDEASANAEKVANALNEFIAEANGDNDVFTRELMRNMRDVPENKKRR